MKSIKVLILIILFFATNFAVAQNLGINNSGASPSASAGLDIDFTDKGLLLPRVALTATNVASPVTNPSTSLLVYNTATAGTKPRDVVPGIYYWDGSGWSKLLDDISQKTILSADVSNATITLADVTNLSFPVSANKTYKFKFVIYFTTSNTSSSGRFTLNGPTFATNGLYYNSSSGYSLNGALAIQPQTTYDAGTAFAAAYTTTLNLCTIEGTVATTASGTIIARFASRTAGTTITVLGTGALVSYVEWEQLN